MLSRANGGGKRKRAKEVTPTRLFVGTSLADSAFAQAVGHYQQRLRRLGWEGAYVDVAVLHLTWLFLGEVEPAQAEVLAQELEQLREYPAAVWRVDEVGAFGPPTMPRVVWVGSRRASKRLETLRDVVVRGMLRAGWAGEVPPWAPHVTLLRPRRRGETALPAWSPQAVSIGEISLVHSTLTPRGPIYRPLATVPLSRPGGEPS